MKKLLSFLAIGIVAIMAWSCSDDDNDAPITYDQLPQAAKTFITTYYPSDKIVSVDRDGKNDKTEYDVRFASGHEVEFDGAGQWTDVSAPAQQSVPAGIVPPAIQDYVTTNFPAYGINEISVEKYGYEIELTNGLDLPFDQSGVFIGHLN